MRQIVISLAYLCTTLQIMQIKCDTICKHEGDEIGIVLDDKCFCANSKDMSKVIYKVPKYGGQVAEKKKSYYD